MSRDVATIGSRTAGPCSTSSVQCERDGVDWSSAILNDDGHPEQSANSLRQSCCGGKVCCLRYVTTEIRIRLRPQKTWSQRQYQLGIAARKFQKIAADTRMAMQYRYAVDQLRGSMVSA